MNVAVAEHRRLPLATVALAVVVVALLVGGAAAAVQMRADRLQQESRTYAERVGASLASHLSSQALLAQATPELAQSLKQQGDRTALDAQLSHFGRPWRHLGASGRLDDSDLAPFGIAVTASYAVKASYAPGVVTFELGLVKRRHWMISRFHVDLLTIHDNFGHG